MAKKLISTPDPLLLKIPMKSYLVKFLTKRFGKLHKAGKSSWLGIDVLNILTKDYQKPPAIASSDSFFTIIVPIQICKTYGYFPKYSEFAVLEKKWEKQFRDLMYEHLSINQHNDLYCKKVEVLNGLRNFLRFYDISEDELKLETLYRNYRRYLEIKQKQDRKKLA